jgi:REP element-mobilizing transposase RayT
MATARRLLVDPTSSGVFHCVSRCVRRAYLCGWDAPSGRDFEHRREWIRDRLRGLASLFGVEVYSYAVMSNHFHVVLRTHPGRIARLTDAEVARRWLSLFPGPGGRRGHPPEVVAIENLCLDGRKLVVCRERLADVSWFMRCLNEPIARRANREDECTGRFWEGRFKCQKLDDEGAILACMAYVDLNPVRAAMATTPESSDFTSAQDRATACQARRQLAAAPTESTPAQQPLLAHAHTEALRDHWLFPFATPGIGATDGQADRLMVDGAPSFLEGMSVENYLELLDWTGRQLRSEKRGHIPPNLRPVLDRLDLAVEAWVENVQRYGSLFHRLVGKIHRLRELARSLGRSWLHGHAGARHLYTQDA